MFTEKYTVFLKAISVVIPLLITIWSIYNIFISQNALIKIPLLNNTFITKKADKDYSEKLLFDRYLSYMDNKGYTYLPDERTGGIIVFEIDNKKIFTIYPKFIKIK